MAVVADAAGSQVKSSRGLDSETRSVHSDKRKKKKNHVSLPDIIWNPRIQTQKERRPQAARTKATGSHGMKIMDVGHHCMVRTNRGEPGHDSKGPGLPTPAPMSHVPCPLLASENHLGSEMSPNRGLCDRSVIRFRSQNNKNEDPRASADSESLFLLRLPASMRL